MFSCQKIPAVVERETQNFSALPFTVLCPFAPEQEEFNSGLGCEQIWDEALASPSLILIGKDMTGMIGNAW